MPIGTVKWFNATKGYGFIQPNDGSKDVFVHISALERSDLGQLVEGQKVQFDLERGVGQHELELLELHAVRHYAERGEPGVLDAHEQQMRALRDRARKRFTDELGREFVRADLALHRTLVESLDNALFAETYRVNADRILLMQLTNRLNAERLTRAIDEHLEIIAALRRRDPDAAAAALSRHLQAAQRKMMGVA